MSVIIISGSTGLVGSEVVSLFHSKGFEVVGIDNDMRRQFFDDIESNLATRDYLKLHFPNYIHKNIDIRDQYAIERIFEKYHKNITAVIHTAGQPSHDWAASEPHIDFSVNANGTLNMLEATRKNCADAAFIFCSTNKVYGSSPNKLPLEELETRLELIAKHRYYSNGISEDMTIDQSLHSLFGVSKTSADLLVQEYGLYFGMNTASFRAGCITGGYHRATSLHGFLAFLAKCVARGIQYKIHGYQGKQVRDNIHAQDIASAFWEYSKSPKKGGSVYNLGGGRANSCSIVEAISLFEKHIGRKLVFSNSDHPRIGDHQWWITDTTKFRREYQNWVPKYTLENIISDLCDTYSC